MFLPIALAVAVSVPAPSVGAMALAEMVRFADGIVVATVETISIEPVEATVEIQHGRPGGTVRLSTLRVERWIKGRPTADALVFLNQGTWVCDITGADAGERALFFLYAPQDDTLRAGIPTYVETFGERPLLRVLHAGRGQMGLRSVAGEDLATCWTDDVRLPDDAPRRPGPESEYSFIESIPLEWLAREIPVIAASQNTPQVRLEALSGGLPGLPWQLTVCLDRTATLVVGHPAGALSHELVLAGSTARAIDKALEKTRQFQAVRDLGVPPRGGWDRRLVVMTPEGEHEVRLGVLDAAYADPAAQSAAELWTAIRGALDVPEAIDHRKVDAKLVE